METKFNFKSAICTDINQSKRLLALGLKQETADMALIENWEYDLKDGKFFTGEYFERPIDYVEGMTGHYIPAWSLHRLIDMMPKSIHFENEDWYKIIYNNSVCYQRGQFSICRSCKSDLYVDIINCIEWLIKEGYFKKEYLV